MRFDFIFGDFMADKNKKNNKKKWIRPRHTVVRHTLGIFFRAYSRIKYGARIRPFKEEGKRQYLVLFNHQTAFDQFFESERGEPAVLFTRCISRVKPLSLA